MPRASEIAKTSSSVGENVGRDNGTFMEPQSESTFVDTTEAGYLRHRNSNDAAADDEREQLTDASSNFRIEIDDGNDVHGSEDLNISHSRIDAAQRTAILFVARHHRKATWAVLVALLLLYLAYVSYAMTVQFGDEASVRLLVCTVLGVFLLVLNLTWRYVVGWCRSVSKDRTVNHSTRIRTAFRWALYVVSLIAMVTMLIVMVAINTPGNLVSLAGLAAFVGISWITSNNPARVNWHPVFWGFSLQFFFAAMILRTRWGYATFKWLGDRISEFLTNYIDGAIFVFGPNYNEHFVAFSISSLIVFFSAVISVLYYLGVMQAIIMVLGKFLSFCMGTTPAESLSAAANIFLSMVEAPMMIRPYIGKMTRSELHSVMTGGFATIAGGVLAVYIGFGVPANHLLSASVMSAPAALAISKLTYPETEKPQIQEAFETIETEKDANLIEAISTGATKSIVLVGSLVVNIIAFLSVLSFVNTTLNWFGDRAGVEGLSFQLICSYVLYPVALFMGTELGPDCRRIAELVGIKTFTNEFIAYRSLKMLMANRQVWKNYTSTYDVSDPANVVYNDLDVNLTRWNKVLEGGFLTPRSEVIATYALCGFSNFGSMGILLGGMTAMAPDRKHDMASIVLRAMIAGNTACFFTACVAGLFFEDFE